MLSFSPLERQEKRGDEWEFSVILRINEWLEQTGYRQLLSIADGAGSKAFQAQLYIAGLKYLELDKFLRAFEQIEWAFPSDVQLFVKEENDSAFRLYRFAGQWLESVDLAPPDGVAVIVVVPAVYNRPFSLYTSPKQPSITKIEPKIAPFGQSNHTLVDQPLSVGFRHTDQFASFYFGTIVEVLVIWARKCDP
jgi:hypothetical protein